jgi:hypothetical protein
MIGAIVSPLRDRSDWRGDGNYNRPHYDEYPNRFLIHWPTSLGRMSCDAHSRINLKMEARRQSVMITQESLTKYSRENGEKS